MTEKSRESEALALRETIQLERDQVREKIRELIEAEYAKLEEEAVRIAPDFDYEAEGEKLKAEEAEQLAKIEFAWTDNAVGPFIKKAAEESGQEPEEAGPAEPESGEAAEETVATAEEAPAAKEKKEYGPLPAARVSPSRYPKPKYVPKSKAAAALFGDKHKRTLTAALVMLAMFTAYQAWDYLVPKTVNIDYVTYEGTDHIEYATTARTVGEMMSDLAGDGGVSSEGGKELSISDNDLLDTDESIPVRNGLSVGIRHATKATAMIAGRKQKLWLVPGTVSENLDLNDIAYDEDDEIRPAPESKVSRRTSISVNEIHYDTKEKKEKIEAVDKVILDPSLTSGVQETSEGNDGEGVFTYTTKYVNGKSRSTTREVKEWITEPHDNLLRLGTSATGTSGEYVVARTFTANTTAYTARAGARGALGMGVHLGTCAVDPGFVGLRSELWIEGYGYAFANDTGGAVKGNVVDLYMNSRGQCVSWGRRNKTAYVLVPAE